MLRGDVFGFKLPKGVGREQRGGRFGVVVQAAEFLPRSVVIVAPTSRNARPASFRPQVQVGGETTQVLVEQIGAVDTRRLGDLAGHLSLEELWEVDEALRSCRESFTSAIRGAPVGSGGVGGADCGRPIRSLR